MFRTSFSLRGHKPVTHWGPEGGHIFLASLTLPGLTVLQAQAELRDHEEYDAGPALQVPVVLRGESFAHTGKGFRPPLPLLRPPFGSLVRDHGQASSAQHSYNKLFLWRYKRTYRKVHKKGTIELSERKHLCNHFTGQELELLLLNLCSCNSVSRDV